MGERFARIPDSVFTSGAWSKLSGAAAKVYAALALHADKEGRCWPGRETLRRLVGGHPNAVSRSVRELAKAGLIQLDRVGGGDARPTIYRLTPSATSQEGSAGATQERPTCAERVAPALPEGNPMGATEKRQRFERVAPALQEGSASVTRTTKEQQSNSKENTAVDAAAVSDDSVTASIMAVLEVAGVWKSERATLAKRADAAGLDNVAVAMFALEARGKAQRKANGNAPALLAKMIRDGEQTTATPKPDPRHVCDAINAGLLPDIAGESVGNRKAKYNARGVTLGGDPRIVWPPAGKRPADMGDAGNGSRPPPTPASDSERREGLAAMEANLSRQAERDKPVAMNNPDDPAPIQGRSDQADNGVLTL